MPNKRNQPLIKGHSSAVKDFTFNAFNPYQLITCSADAYMKLWVIPETGYVDDVTAPEASWITSGKDPLRGVAFHPSIAGLVASRSSRRLFLWDINGGSGNKEIAATAEDAFNADIQSWSWSYDGSTLLTTSKDKTLRVIDTRIAAGSGQVVASAKCHDGIRHSRVAHLGNSNHIVTTGHGAGDAAKTRQVTLWDLRNLDAAKTDSLSSAVKTLEFDTGANYGNQVVPLFDGGHESSGAGLLTLLPKAEHSATVYAFDGGDFTAMSESVSLGMSNTLGACLLPRQRLDFSSNEVARVLVLSDKAIKPLTIRGQQLDNRTAAGIDGAVNEAWFPPSVMGAAASPDVTVENYMSGQNAAPQYVPIDFTATTKEEAGSKPPQAAVASSSSASSSASSFSVSSSVKPSVTGGVMELDAEERIRRVLAAEEEAHASRSSKVATSSVFAQTATRLSQFQYMRCDEGKQKDSFLDLRVSTNPMLGDSPLLSASPKLWAFPWEGTGGRVFVCELTNPRKLDAAPASIINAHDSGLSDLSFSPFHDNILATAGADCTLKVWKLPLGGSNSLDVLSSWTDSDAMLCKCLDSPVQSVIWHPTVAGVVVTTTHENTVYMHFLDGTELYRKRISDCDTNSVVSNTSFSPSGTMIALGCKDNCIRVIDPRLAAKGTASEVRCTANDIGRNVRVVWCGDSEGGSSCIVSVSAYGNNRVISTWDPEDLSAPLSRTDVDAASGQLYPMYDASTQLLFLVGKGDTTLRTFDLRIAHSATGKLEVSCGKCSEHPSADSQATWSGMCFLPKQTCDVKAVQVVRMVKIAAGRMVPLGFILPRSDAQKGYFQDELFPPVPTWEASEAHTHDKLQAYLDGSSKGDNALLPALKSLRPVGMPLASEEKKEQERASASRPSSNLNSYKAARIREEQEKEVKDANFLKLQALAMQRAANHPNHSMGNGEVDSDDNWSDDD
jgi:WD40 repeat protein